MLQYSVKVKVIGSGKFFRLKKNTKIPYVKWCFYMDGGYIFRFGDDCYTFRPPKIPHCLWWYYEKYHVEYTVEYRGDTFSWKHFHSLGHLHVEDGDIVIDMNNNVRYLMVKNPNTGQVEHHKIYDL